MLKDATEDHPKLSVKHWITGNELERHQERRKGREGAEKARKKESVEG